jgi:predicted dehydrogenase
VNYVEPLRTETQHFADCVRSGATPLTGIAHARKVVEILERASAEAPLP